MATKKGKGPLFDSGLCRCCGNMKKCRVLNIEYESLGQKEVYSDMIMDCFSLLLSHLDGVPSERLICATCVTRIRDALSFRRQVLRCEEAFLQMKIYDARSDDSKMESQWNSKVNVDIVVKDEPGTIQSESDDEHCADALADAPDDDLKPDKMEVDPDDLPLKHHVTQKKEQTRTLIESAEIEPVKQEQQIPRPKVAPPPMPKPNQVILNKATPNNMHSVHTGEHARSRIVLLKDQGYTVTEIATELGLTRKTVYLWLRRWANSGNLNELKGTGRPRKTSLEQDAKIIRSLKEKGSIQARELAAAHNVSANTVRRRIQEVELPMSKVQQLMRERDSTYMTETNILTIVEYSFVCPFKCRHNHLLCYYCGELYSDPALLRHHTTEMHHPKKFKVTEHKKMVKIDLTRIDCRLCGVKINDLEEFKRHISGVHKKKYYFNYKDSVLPFRLTRDELKCALCDVLFPYFHALNKHMNEHFSNYVCETCGLGFVDKGRFMMHQQRHEEGDFPCPDCGKVFKAQYNRDLHIDRVHRKKGRVYCPKCDVKLMSYPQKLKHLVEVHGEEPLSFSCTMCERIFDTRRTLTIHRRKDHLKDFRYECQCCGQKFFTRFALNNHMPTHTGERNFKCKVCEKCYPRLKTLKDHMRIHTNDRRYRCHVCGQAFIQNCSLKGHMKSQHPEYEMRM